MHVPVVVGRCQNGEFYFGIFFRGFLYFEIAQVLKSKPLFMRTRFFRAIVKRMTHGSAFADSRNNALAASRCLFYCEIHVVSGLYVWTVNTGALSASSQPTGGGLFGQASSTPSGGLFGNASTAFGSPQPFALAKTPIGSKRGKNAWRWRGTWNFRLPKAANMTSFYFVRMYRKYCWGRFDTRIACSNVRSSPDKGVPQVSVSNTVICILKLAGARDGSVPAIIIRGPNKFDLFRFVIW